MLSIRGLTVTYPGRPPTTVLHGVDLDLSQGDILGLAGESGCGKSTLVLAALRLLPPDVQVTGSVLLDGADVLTLSWGQLRSLRWATIAVTVQGADLLNPVRRVGTQIAEPIRLHTTLPRGERTRRVAGLLELVGLPAAYARAYPHQLSGGEAQRVAIAMAMACDPRLLVVDETTTGLDLSTRSDVLDVLTKLASSGATVVLVSHDLPMLASVSSHLAIMYAGRIVEHGPLPAVCHAPLHPYTRGLLEVAGTIGDAGSRRRPRGLPGDPPDPTLPVAGCAFRPRCVAATVACATPPALRIHSTGRSVACHEVPG